MATPHEYRCLDRLQTLPYEREKKALSSSYSLDSQINILRVKFDSDILPVKLLTDRSNCSRAEEGVEDPVSRSRSCQNARFDQ